MATRNAERHNVIGRVTFVETDLLDGVDARAHLIVAESTYVPANASNVWPEVARYEPHTALYAGDEGLDVIRRLLADAPQRLAELGWLIMEFGFGQEPAVRAAAADAGWQVARIRSDLQEIPRVAVLRLKP